MEMQVTVKGEVVKFDSPFESVDEAVDALAKSGTRSEFARDIIDKHEKYGLSEKQQAWAHKLAVDANRPPPEDLDLGLDGIARMLQALPRDSRRKPSIAIDVHGQSVSLSLNGEKSRTPGSITLTDGKPFGENKYFGRISPEGVVSPSRSWTDEIQKAVVRLNETGEVNAPKEEDDDLPF